MFMRMAATLRGTVNEERLQEELLVGEGLTLALLLPRVSYAVDRLLTFIQRVRSSPDSRAPEGAGSVIKTCAPWLPVLRDL